jgi:glycerol-3-phosphate acyltransferase PlsX
MKIILDAMGGDNAPLETVKGAALAVAELDANILLVGNKNKIDKVFDDNDLSRKNIGILHTEQIISMDDDPVSVVRSKRGSSLGVALKVFADDKNNEFGALVSAGNSGALLAGSSLLVKCVPDIKRAALAVVMPFERNTLLIDAGANIDVKAEYLKQFGFMGSIYMNKIFNIESPTVGLVNNGMEQGKGTPEHIEAYELLSKTKTINFRGNIEGRDIAVNPSDVIVTDGFTGNIILKFTEGCGVFMGKKLREMFLRDIFTKISAGLLRKSLGEFKKSFDQSEYGGAPFLGLRKTVIKAHGSSDAKAIKNAIRQAKFCIETKIIEQIETESQINR